MQRDGASGAGDDASTTSSTRSRSSFLDLVDALDDEIDELEDHVEDWPARADPRAHLRPAPRPAARPPHARADARRGPRASSTAASTLDEAASCSRATSSSHFADAYDKLLRAIDGLELSRDLLAGVRDYHQAKIANDQNEVMKRLTVIASILLLPTFIVGLYGQNFRQHPGARAGASATRGRWGLIIVTTICSCSFRWLTGSAARKRRLRC